jgi:hypothetical protein
MGRASAPAGQRKSQAVNVSADGQTERQGIRLHERARLPWGRASSWVDEQKPMRHCWGKVIGITAEAGMGKSRLMAEVIRWHRRECWVWWSTSRMGPAPLCGLAEHLSGFLNLDPGWTAVEQIESLGDNIRSTQRPPASASTGRGPQHADPG